MSATKKLTRLLNPRSSADGIRSEIHLAVLCALIIMTLAACNPPGVAVFADEGETDGTTVEFELRPQIYVVRWAATDREPWHGCDFSVRLLMVDETGGGIEVGGSPEVLVHPRGRVDDEFPVQVLDGTYFFRLGGSCAWRVSVTPT